MADIVEQRKLILDDNPEKSEEEAKELLKKAHFDLSRSYQVVRGLNSTAYIQDIDAANPKKETKNDTDVLVDDPFFGKVLWRDLDGAEAKKKVSSPAGQRIQAIIELLTNKIERDEPLTPIELMVAEMFAKGVTLSKAIHSKEGKCPGCGKDHAIE